MHPDGLTRGDAITAARRSSRARTQGVPWFKGVIAGTDIAKVKTITVKDPCGIVWHVYRTGEIVHTADLERAVAQSSMSERDKKKRRAAYGVQGSFPFPGWEFFQNYRWRVGKWNREHSPSSVIHGVSKGEHRAWISPALTRRQAQGDVEEIAAQIKLGEEPRPLRSVAT
jgi:hypothetical protein